MHRYIPDRLHQLLQECPSGNEKATLPPLDKMHEECGIFGIHCERNIDTFSMAQFGLFALQHRGQEACGITVLKNGKQIIHKDEGLVLDVFKNIPNPDNFMGNSAIGHNRYTTAGDKKKYNYQPLFANNEYDIPILSIAHNGNLTNAKNTRKDLETKGVIFRATSDSEVILRLLQTHLDKGLESAIQHTMNTIRGAYSVVGLTTDSFFAFRDPNGIRPLVMGITLDSVYVFASETCALDAVGAKYIRDIEPGEIIIITQRQAPESSFIQTPSNNRLCSFEYIYFARPDTNLDFKNIYKIREECGKMIYLQNPIQADVVIGVPDSGIPAAIGFSEASGIPFRPILIKNKYIGRSFIIPGNEMRERLVNLKLNPILSEFKGKTVVVIDDSIVRGTTSKRLVKILREAGAVKIHFRSVSPPILFPCFLGIATPDKKDLIAANMNKADLIKALGVDTLEFLALEGLKTILKNNNYCFGCFNGKYPVLQED